MQPSPAISGCDTVNRGPGCQGRILLKNSEWIGWASSVILLVTLVRQVYTQWRTRTDAGVSRWLFAGQVTASIGYTIYSVLLHNWVFICSNLAILTTAVVGELVYIRNRKR
jgi:uncharacterized protein with PQ loop repeat